MAQEITVPRLGWSMEEATLAAWLKGAGEKVAVGDPLFALESEKATQDIEALDAGVLFRVPNGPRVGDRVRVGQCLGYLLVDGETPPLVAIGGAGVAVDRDAANEASEDRAQVDRSVPAEPRETQDAIGSDVRISPRALRVAHELGVPWRQIHGTGRGGRIRENDIRGAAVPNATKSAAGHRRRIISERLVAGLRASAPVTLHSSVDATGLVAWRQRLKAEAGVSAEGVPGYTEMLVQLTAQALRRHPALNARCEAGEWVSSGQVHLGIAVDTEEGLLVPVVRDAQDLDLVGLTARIRELVRRARAGVLTAEESSGGTFTLTNLGAYGVDTFTPIVNPPECAILGVGRIARRPVVVGDRIVPRDTMDLSLTFDHRALDGVPAAKFVHTLRGLIEGQNG